MRERFTVIANMPDQERKFPVGPDSAIALGYDVQEIGSLPSAITESFCGVGNPLGLAALQPGHTVLDLGSGAGLDSVLAARRVGPTGAVVGIDMTEAMLAKSRLNVDLLHLQNVQFLFGSIDDLSLKDGSVDVAISNGVFNLCLDKPKVLREVHRVLRPGGRLQMADILLHDDVTSEEVASKGTWSD
ncbi:MAG: methyltransferase domain-containing protein [Pirellulaceae bacterium]